jgi:uncharacterized membrane protein
MADLRQFCAEFGIDEDLALRSLARERGELTSALAMPWYVRLVIGFGAWVTAIVAIVLGVAIIFLIDTQHPTQLLILLGVAYLAAGLLLLRTTGNRIFLTQLGVAIAAAGVAMMTIGIIGEWSKIWLAFLVSLAATVVIVATTSNRTLQFLAALLTAFLFTSTLTDSNVPYFLAIAALAGPAGMFLLLRPLQWDLHPLAVVLLLVFPIFDWLYTDAVSFGLYQQTIEPGAWLAKSLNIALFLSLTAIHWQRTGTADARTRLSVFAVAAIVVGLLLPPGGSAALMILMLAFVLGSRPLALLGVLLQIIYIWRFYYDMEATLLVKSGILMAVGSVLVLAWWLMMRRSPEGVRL